MQVKDTYAIMVSLPETVLESERYNYRAHSKNFSPLIDQKKLFETKLLADEARARGLKLAVIFDYFVLDPYHGKPPHVSASTGKIVKSTRDRARGLGYLPFAWPDGWNFARKVIATYVAAINPEFIQQGVDHSTMNWYREGGPAKPHWGYNDVMGMFNQAITEDNNWKGTYVVSAWYSPTLSKARYYFDSAIKDVDLMNRVTFELPGSVDPPDDDDDTDPVDPPVDQDYVTRSQFIEVTMKIADMFANLEGRVSELENWRERVDQELDDIQGELDANDEILNRVLAVFGGWLL